MSERFLTHDVVGTSFGFYSEDNVKDLSVCKVTSPQAFDTLGHEVPGGLYDPGFGPKDVKDGNCKTCRMSYAQCPGHMGHIDLVVPVYNPLLFGIVFKLLRYKCFTCHRFKIAAYRTRVCATKLALLDVGKVSEALNLDIELGVKRRTGESVEDAHERRTTRLDEYDAMLKDMRPVPQTTHLRENRTAIISEFLRSQPTKACSNCKAHAVILKKDGYAKIFQKHLSKKSQQHNSSLGHRLEPALVAAGASLSDSDDDDTWNGSSSTPAAGGGGGATDPSAPPPKAMYMPPSEAEEQMRLLWEKEEALVSRIWSSPLTASGARLGAKEGWRIFFLRVLPVTPSRFRPPTKMGEMQFEHPQNFYLTKVLNLNEQLQVFAHATTGAGAGSGSGDAAAADADAEGERDDEGKDDTPSKSSKIDLSKALSVWIALQEAVNALIDSSKITGSAASKAPSGIRQLLERKEGLFRMNMMGKRVNFAARSVISPDPLIRTDQIGVPVRFAKTLTYAQPVNPYNVVLMRKLVMNGPDVHPGANFLEMENGDMIDLSKRNAAQREAMAKTLLTPAGSGTTLAALGACKKVYRHLRDGDIVLMNRQPSLHRSSIMAHRARVLRNPTQQTLRMHYADCKTYNADFDGDEMNMHFPQDELARAEGYHIASAPRQYVVPTSGSPIMGLIQDHVGSAVLLTKQDTFLTRDEYMQLVYAALEGLPYYQENPGAPIPTVGPTILKPRPLWTGKQVVTTLLRALSIDIPPPANEINVAHGTKTGAAPFGLKKSNPFGDHRVLVRKNEMLLGVIDKAAIGNSSFGMVHAVQEVFGAAKASGLLSSFGRVFTEYLSWVGITCGLADLVLTEKAEEGRKQLKLRAVDRASRVSAEFAGIEPPREYDLKSSRDPPPPTRDADWLQVVTNALRVKLRSGEAGSAEGARLVSARLDNAVKAELSKAHSDVLDYCLPSGLAYPFPVNRFSLMVLTGAKGSVVNHAMIVAALGQQELEGRRVPVMASGKSLPSFAAFDPSPRAGGYIGDRFLSGVRPQEYYFHCMSGREGLVDTAVKTSTSGYLQRCLVKHLEDLKVHYDYTVRNAEGGIVQFTYGEDGLDPTRAAYLRGADPQMDFIAENFHAYAHKYGVTSPRFKSAFNMTRGPAAHKVVQSARRHVEARGSGSGDVAAVAFTEGQLIEFRLPQSKGFASEVSWTRGTVRKVREGKPNKSSKKSKKASELGSTGTTLDIEYQGLDGEPVTAKKVPVHSESHGEIVRVVVPDPVLATVPIASTIGAVSERIEDVLESYVSRNPSKLLRAPGGGGGAGNAGGRGTLTPAAFNSLLWVKYARSLVDPGEPVGTIAAQSVGEPSTQMTLNTFHLAGSGGVNVTLGIPRLREIVMTASQSIKTPAMTLPMRLTKPDGSAVTRGMASQVARKLGRLTLGDLVATHRPDGGIRVTERLVPADGRGGHGAEWVREYRAQVFVSDVHAIRGAFGLSFESIVQAAGRTFVPQLLRTIASDLRKAGRAKEAGVMKAASGAGEPGSASGSGVGDDANAAAETTAVPETEDVDDVDDVDNVDDAEAGTLRLGRRNDATDYGKDDEADEAGSGSDSDESLFGERARAKEDGAKKDSAMELDEDDAAGSGSDDILTTPKPKKKSKKSASSESKTPRSTSRSKKSTSMNLTIRKLGAPDSSIEMSVPGHVTRNPRFLGAFGVESDAMLEVVCAFPASARKVMMLSAAERAAGVATIRSIKGISRAVVNDTRLYGETQKRVCVQTEGVNLAAVWRYGDLLDVDAIATNDVGAILRMYGVEAARNAIVREIKSVFGVYGIQVDNRHLSLIADYMTYSGGYRAMNRLGMTAQGSPYTKMSFETTTRFLTDACIHGEMETMESPSSRLVMGRVVASGTGCIDVYQKLG